jgi:hypothetical protein
MVNGVASIFTLDTTRYTGIVVGFWAAVNGNALITEIF